MIGDKTFSLDKIVSGGTIPAQIFCHPHRSEELPVTKWFKPSTWTHYRSLNKQVLIISLLGSRRLPQVSRDRDHLRLIVVLMSRISIQYHHNSVPVLISQSVRQAMMDTPSFLAPHNSDPPFHLAISVSSGIVPDTFLLLHRI